MIAKIIFFFYLWTGTIEPQGDNEGRPLYQVHTEVGGPCIEVAYRGEILNWIEQGKPNTFTYNEELED